MVLLNSRMIKLCAVCFNFQGGIATLLTMPLDVMKTRMMNASPGQYKVSTTL